MNSPSMEEEPVREDNQTQQQIFVLGDSLSAGYKLAYEDSYPARLEEKLRQ